MLVVVVMLVAAAVVVLMPVVVAAKVCVRVFCLSRSVCGKHTPAQPQVNPLSIYFFAVVCAVKTSSWSSLCARASPHSANFSPKVFNALFKHSET